MIRLAVTARGLVQGVGLRPFVHRAATQRGLAGWVRNRGNELHLEVEGSVEAVHELLAALRRDTPLPARIEQLDVSPMAPLGAKGFCVLESEHTALRHAGLPVDLAVCAECAAEVDAPADRRYGHPFTSCAHCGPRYSLIESLPYDRVRTAMRDFALCADCAAEYTDSLDRRFHAETIACPRCGPVLRLVAGDGRLVAERAAALAAAAAALERGEILALKGLGGFQLLADATSDAAVARLRARKGRPDKPFAVMFRTIADVARECWVGEAEERVLASAEAPILLLSRRRAVLSEAAVGAASRPRPVAAGSPDAPDLAAFVVAGVAPGSPLLGAMLPTTPLHRLLLAAHGRPVVCTSGNRSEEPICSDEAEAHERLGSVADFFLEHDRRILRPVDDSVARIGLQGLELLRRARGFAPLPLRARGTVPGVVALGAHQKSTVAITLHDEVVLSQHLGDLGSPEGAARLARTVDDLLRLLEVRAVRLACDLHPDYASTRLAERLATERGLPLHRVQHHHAHVAACAAEHGLEGPLLGIAWDGAGLGTDGVLWGGEGLWVDGVRWQRIAHLRPFPLLGGERAAREPRRVALALLHALAPDQAAVWGAAAFERPMLRSLLALLEAWAPGERGGLVPAATSVGRLFDGVAALAGLRPRASFEGQAAIELEHAARGLPEPDEAYPLPLGVDRPAVADWAPLIAAVWRDVARGTPVSLISARFHAALAELAVAVAERARLGRVVLAGGCFQNERLVRGVRARLERAGFDVYSARLVPPNDGAIALGQAIVAARPDGAGALDGRVMSDPSAPRDVDVAHG